MKRLTIAAAVLSTVFMSAGAFAETDQGEVITVSYTHLDVYKRQGKGSRLTGRPAASPRGSISFQPPLTEIPG